VEQNDLSLSRPSTLHYSSEIHPYVSEFCYICRYIQEYSMDRDIKNIVMDKGYVQNTIFELLSRLGIGYEKLEHSPIITMKEGSEIAYKLGSTSCKNLFLCNKRQEYFMLMLPADKKLSAKNVARQIGSPHLSFASAEDMERLLHTYPGAVSVLSLIYDKEKRVQLLIDKGLMNVTYIGCHPCTNTCSLKIKMEDILTVWLPATGHDDMKVIE
jgi:Ala-tRNA(Pro) deacylase